MNGEPIGVSGLKAAALSVIALAIALGAPIDDTLQNAIVGVLPFVALAYTWYSGRKGTVPVEKANENIKAASMQSTLAPVKPLLFTKG